MRMTYEFPLPPKECPSREPGGYYTIYHDLTDASMASRRRERLPDLDTVDTRYQAVGEDVDNTHDLNTRKDTDNTNAVSDKYNVCNQPGAHLLA